MKKEQYKKIIIEGCYDLREGETPEQYIVKRFNSEMGYNLKRQGLLKTCDDWIRGLALNITYTNFDIVKIMGYSEAQINSMPDHKYDRLVERYWANLAVNLAEIITIEQKKNYKEVKA